MHQDGFSPPSLSIMEDDQAPEQETLSGGVFVVLSIPDE